MHEKVIAEWKFVRGLSLDLLAALSKEGFSYAPLDGMGEFWRQFRHVGRVQEDYVRAIERGQIEFSTSTSSYTGGPSQQALLEYLKRCDETMFQQLQPENTGPDQQIDWFGEKVGLTEHLVRLVAHETFHHGQWVIYMQGLKEKMPESWSAWGFE